MRSERVQRRIDSLLDEAETAIADRDWALVRARCESVLALDPENADARAYVDAANRADLDGASVETGTPAPAPPAPAQPAAPSSFAGGRYEVREFLGEGGKKRVFLAHDSLLDREVAFALIRTEGLDDAGRERITREAQAMGRLGDHPHIVPVLDLGQEDVNGVSQPYIVSQYMAGGSAKDVLAEADGDLPLERTLSLAMDVCRGLEAAHGDNVVHRDLSLGNVWLAEDGTAKIGDFGLAVSLDRTRLTQAGMMVGTATYMPPEQALSGAVTPQSDLYSLGVMLYELVTGRPPFVGDDPTAVISQHINTPPVAPSWHSEHCPPDLEALILHLLQKVPEDRPESASEVLAALERVDPEAASASHSDSGANPLDRLAQGVFVGRESELERLRSAFDRAFAGAGGVVMVVGDPGIGKTRMVTEVETHARMRGAQVLWGRTHESSGAPAYWPWVQAIRSHVATTDDETLRAELGSGASEVARIVSEVRERLPDLPEPQAITDPESAQFRLFDAVSVFLRNASANTPLVVVLDDLHWADRPTLLMMAHLAREIGRARLLVVGTYRDTDLGRQHPLSAALAEMNREQLFERVPLRGLTREEVEAYVRQTANTEPSRTVLDRIFEETEGNPFFLSQVVALMAQQGTLAATSLSDVALPEGVVQALGQRLDRLSEECNELLSVAAVSGREFSHELLAATTEHDDETLLGLVEEALDGRVVEETETPGEYRFTHALMQETLLGELSTARRVRLHGRIAEALEALRGDRAERYATELAHHFGESALLNREHAERAVKYSKLAAERAFGENAWDEATRHFEQCLTLLAEGDHDDGNTDVDALLGLGLSAANTADFRTARRSLDRAMELLQVRGDSAGFVRAALQALDTGVYLRQDARLATRALEVFDGDDAEIEARLLSHAAWRMGFTEQADEAADRARELAQHYELPTVLGELSRREASRAAGDFRFEEASRHLARTAEYLSEAGRIGTAIGAFITSGLDLQLAGQLDAASSVYREALDKAQTSRFRSQEYWASLHIGNVQILRGDFDDAQVTAHALPETSPERWALLSALAETGRVELGDVPDEFSTRIIASASAVRARALSVLGHEREAREALTVFGRWFAEVVAGENTQAWANTFHAIGQLGESLATLGEEDLVESIYDRLSSGLGLHSIASSSADEFVGFLALRLGRLDEAQSSFEAGLEWCERERCPIEAGRCHQGLAEVAIRRNDTAEAMQHLDAASKLFEQYGAKLYLDQVIAKKLELQGVGSSDGSDGVTIVAPEPGETLPSGGAE